jgi:hypothetical protein
MNHNHLKSVLEWMKFHPNCGCDDEGIGYKCGEFATFPISHKDYMQLWEDILIGGGIREYWKDQGWNKEEDYPFPEARYYFEYEGTKFIEIWMSGQGDACLLVFPNDGQENGRLGGVPWDESKKIVIK